MAFLAVFVALKIAHIYRAGGYAVWSWIPAIWDLRSSEYHLVELRKSVKRIFVATYLFTPDYEFGMTQAFSGQVDGTSGTGMGLKTPKPRSLTLAGKTEKGL
jgi:hypothetical protein